MYDDLIKRLRESKNEQCYIGCFGNCVDCEIDDELEQAADAIEKLEKALNAVSDAHNEGYDVGYWAGRRDYEPKWIPVEERLPETDKCVLVISYGRVCFAKLLLTKNNGGYPTFVLQDGLNNQPVLETTAHNEFTENRITHWQYLPEPPKDEKDGIF